MNMVALTVVLGIALLIYQFVLKNNSNKSKIQWIDFEKRMINRGFTKRIIVYDFLTQGLKRDVEAGSFKHLRTVGIWLDYQKRLASLRPDGETWNEIDIPFDKIQDVQIIEDGTSRMTGGAIGYGMIAVGSTKMKEICSEVKVKIVIGDNNTGVQTHNIIVYKARISAPYQ